MNSRTINELEYTPRKTEPDAKWAAVVSLSLGVFGLVTAEFLPVSLLTPLSADLSISSGIAGQSITVTALVAAVAGPGVVIGTRSIDRRWTLLGLTTLLIISSTLAAFANGLFMLFASRVLLGIGLGGFWAMSAALALRLVPLDKMPRAMAIILTGVSVATVCAAPVGAWIGATLGWRAAFVVAGVLGVIALLVQLLTVPSLPPAGAPGLATMFRLLQRPQVRIGLLTTLFIVAGHFAGFTYVRPFLEDVPHLGVEAISLVLLVYGIGGFFGNLFGGFLAEKNTAWAVTFAATLIAASASVLVIAGASPLVAGLAIASWGFAFGALPVSVQSFITRVASDEAESAGALLLTTFQIAISSGAVLGGPADRPSGRNHGLRLRGHSGTPRRIAHGIPPWRGAAGRSLANIRCWLKKRTRTGAGPLIDKPLLSAGAPKGSQRTSNPGRAWRSYPNPFHNFTQPPFFLPDSIQAVTKATPLTPSSMVG